MSGKSLTPSAIRGLLAQLLAGAAGGAEATWRVKIGEVEKLPVALHPRCNWRVTPCGSTAEVDAIRLAVSLVAAEHSYVS